MCGIAGIILVGPPASLENVPGRAALQAASRAVAHRGPDGAGSFERQVALAPDLALRVAFTHRRLSVLDPAGGAQPMVRPGPADPRDQVAVVFNGCIYNHAKLRRELLASGHPFSSDHSDTEVLAIGWRARGSAILNDLDGMFAFAVWDARTNTIAIARDRAGEKPLYHTAFHVGPVSCFAFASTVPGLLAIRGNVDPQWRPRIDPEAMRTWAAMGFGPSTPFKDIASLLPGSWATLDPKGSNQVWDMRPWRAAPPDGRLSLRLHEPDDVLAAIDESVRDRLTADVPVGCFLSGGIDSPLIAAAAKRHAPDVRTFTVRMPDAAYDESGRAAAIARHLGTRHTTLGCEPTPCDDLQRLIPQLGLPLGDSSLLPTHWVSRAAREHVTVALSGDGADELFDGYARYRAATLLRSSRTLLSLIPGIVGRGASPRSTRARLARLGHAARGWGYEDLLAVFPAAHWARLTREPAPSGVNDPDALAHPDRADLRSYLPDDLLRKVDTASMAVALEVRAPFLAATLFEGRRQSPSSEHTGRKRLLRQAASRILPSGFAEAPKSGFAIPVGHWFRSNFAGLRTLLRARVLRPDAFAGFDEALPLNRGAIESMLAEHDDWSVDHSQRLYHLLVLSIWSDWVRSL